MDIGGSVTEAALGPPKHELNGLALAVVTGASGLSGELALGLAEAGAQVVTLGVAPSENTDHLPASFETRDRADDALEQVTRRLGRLDALVYAAGVPKVLVQPVSTLDEHDWYAQAVAPVKAALFCFQAAHAHLAATCGRVVVVVPTLAISGAPGLVAASTALEGQRILAKVLARQWGRDGIAVNCLLVSPTDSHPELDDDATGSAVVRRVSFMGSGDVGGSVPRDPDRNAARQLVPLVATLATTTQLLTGSTLVADGGTWMVP